MKLKYILIPALGIVGLAAASYLKTFLSLSRLTINVSGFRIYNWDWSRIVLHFDLAVTNAGRAAVKINEIAGSISADGLSTSGTFKKTSSVTCPGKATTTNIKDIEVTLSNITLVTVLYKMFISKKSQQFTLKGYAMANGNQIPFQTTQMLNPYKGSSSSNNKKKKTTTGKTREA